MEEEVNVEIDLNIPFVECNNSFARHSDVSGINDNLPISSNPQNTLPQQPQGSLEGNSNNINENQAALNSQPPVNRLQNRQNRELSNNERKLIVQQLIYLSKDGDLPKGTMKEKSTEWNVSRTTLWRIWSNAKHAKEVGDVIDVRSKKIGKVGRKAKVFDIELLRAIPIEKRTTVRAVSSVLGIGHSAVYGMMKEGIIRPHTNSIKPKLSLQQKHRRMELILTQIIPPTLHMAPKFSLMYNVVHIDEKFFKMSKETLKVYLFDDEEEHEVEPYRCVQNKHFIGKVIFFAAIARPHIAANGEVLWDGKLGIFPFTEQHVAVRSSGNRPAGTIEERPIASVTRDVIRQKLIEEVLPIIRAKWPINGVKDIFIQQDNARPHIHCNDVAFMEAATKDGFNIRLVCQPATSPDMNILDLGFFNAIQAIQFKAFPKKVEDLVQAVKVAYESYEPTIINYTWIQLHLTLLEVLKVKGGNNYKSPHIGKKKLDRLRLLPQQIEVPCDLIESTKQILEDGIIDLNVPLQEED